MSSEVFMADRSAVNEGRVSPVVKGRQDDTRTVVETKNAFV